MRAAARILDANANRAREALRVMEDVARFALDDAALTGELKTLRHRLREALGAFPEGWLVANRDTPGDVGTMLGSFDGNARRDLGDVAAAAGSRLTEALRVIEETARTLDPEVAGKVEAVRYRAYDVDARLRGRLRCGRAPQWRVCLLLTESLCARPWPDVLRAAIDGGAGCVQVREPQMGGRALLQRVEEVLAIARPAGMAVIVNDRADTALAAGADGVHVGREDLPVEAIRRLAGGGILVGASTHDLDEARRAAAAGADYCGVGTMFATRTKATGPPAGPGYMRAFVEAFPDLPHLAVGGVTPENVGCLAEAGARGVAVCAAVCAAPRPGEVVRRLRDALEAAAPERGG